MRQIFLQIMVTLSVVAALMLPLNGLVSDAPPITFARSANTLLSFTVSDLYASDFVQASDPDWIFFETVARFYDSEGRFVTAVWAQESPMREDTDRSFHTGNPVFVQPIVRSIDQTEVAPAIEAILNSGEPVSYEVSVSMLLENGAGGRDLMDAVTAKGVIQPVVPGAAGEPIVVSAQATRTEFEGFLYGCSSTPPEEQTVTNGGVLHFKRGRNLNLFVTDSPLVDGYERNVVDANINLKTGTGVGHLRSTITPDAVDGTWEYNMTVKVGIGGGGEGGQAVGHGTGELDGMKIKFTARRLTEPAENLCNPDNSFVAAIKGVIISP